MHDTIAKLKKVQRKRKVKILLKGTSSREPIAEATGARHRLYHRSQILSFHLDLPGWFGDVVIVWVCPTLLFFYNLCSICRDRQRATKNFDKVFRFQTRRGTFRREVFSPLCEYSLGHKVEQILSSALPRFKCIIVKQSSGLNGCIRN